MAGALQRLVFSLLKQAIGAARDLDGLAAEPVALAWREKEASEKVVKGIGSIVNR